MLQELTDKIRTWAIYRGLDEADPNKQMLKLMEEIGELSAAIARNDEWETTDAIGDIFVVLTILSMQLGYSVEHCVESAYDEIKDRKGEMVNGVFVKESDLGQNKRDMNVLDWKEAENHLYEMEKAYKSIGFAGTFGLSLTINPLIKRFEEGERTQELHDAIMDIS